MGILRKAMVVSLAVGLIAPSTSPASAAPAPDEKPVKLADALLTEKDLPKGWAVFDAALMGGMMPGALDPSNTGGDPCALPESPPLKDVVTPPRGRAAKKVKLEFAAFMKGDDGPMLLETLAGTGGKTARAMVDDTREMLKRCPVLKSDTLGIEMSALTKFPEVGDDSQALNMTVTLKEGDFAVSVPGKLVAVASGDVYATVALVGTEEPATADLKKFTKRALRKLDKTL